MQIEVSRANLSIIIGLFFASIVFLILFIHNTGWRWHKLKKTSKTKRVPTGIWGLDEIIGGGFVKKSVNLVSGGTGTGKSILALQFCYKGILKNEPFVYLSFEDKPEELKADAKKLGLNFDNVEKEKKGKFLFVYPIEIGNYLEELIEWIKKTKAKRVVIDTISSVGLGSEKDPQNIIKLLLDLIDKLKENDCTSILLSRISGEAPLDITKIHKFSMFNQEEFVSDSVIVLHISSTKQLARRYLRVIKMKRTKHLRLPTAFIISGDGKERGIKITGE